MTESEYWVYKADLSAEQARVVARFHDEDVAVEWAEDSFNDEVVVVDGLEPFPRMMNSQAIVVEVFTEEDTTEIEEDDNED
jgi:hypothetical protein